jgi:hypothetical protein
MEKRKRLEVTSNAEQSLSEFYIQISEENINIVSSQNRVLRQILNIIFL